MSGLVTKALPILLLDMITSNQGHHVYFSLESTISTMSVDIKVKCKTKLLLKMETPPSLS